MISFICRDFMGSLLESLKIGDREGAREWSYLDPWSNLQVGLPFVNMRVWGGEAMMIIISTQSFSLTRLCPSFNFLVTYFHNFQIWRVIQIFFWLIRINIKLCPPNQCPKRVIMVSRKYDFMFLWVHLYPCVL